MKDQQYDYLFKIVLVGDSGVGKSNILSRFKDNRFSAQSKPTIGVEFETKTIKLDSITVKTQIWDTAGQQRFRAITNAYYKGAVGAIVVYDLTKSKSFQGVKKWLEELHNNADEKIVVMLVGNKLDLADNRDVKVSSGEEYAKDNNMLFIETSAATDINIKHAFDTIIKKIYQNVRAAEPKDIKSQNQIRVAPSNKVDLNSGKVELSQPKVEPKKGCC